jgi:hypothetical protein
MRFVPNVLFVILLASCVKREAAPAYTLQTGVKVLEASLCSDSYSPPNFSVKKIQSWYEISVTEAFHCNSDLKNPWLSEPRNGKATLFLAGKSSAGNCECSAKLRVQISGRLSAGETLYVMGPDEIIGHVVLP